MRSTINGRKTTDFVLLSQMDLATSHQILLAAVLAEASRFRSGELDRAQFATNVTHLNFHPAWQERLRDVDPSLCNIIEDLAPDLEVEPSDQRLRELLAAIDGLNHH